MSELTFEQVQFVMIQHWLGMLAGSTPALDAQFMWAVGDEQLRARADRPVRGRAGSGRL